MAISEKLKPELIWKYFEEVSRVPRPSKKEGKITEWLIRFAAEQGLEIKRDAAGNLLITKPAAGGFENRQTVVLQSHMDMVCEKNSDVTHDFENDPIIPVIDGEWVRATGTTLGADDGIGMAAQLAVLASGDLQHGKIECLFTVDEETGLTGAFALEPGFFEGKTLINLDSEDEGELFIGCAGGVDTLATMEYDEEEIPSSHTGFMVKVGGLAGGHSGDDIHRGRGNSNKILNRFLWNLNNRYDMKLVSFNGGNLRNAIPREAEALFSIHRDDAGDMKEYFGSFRQAVMTEMTEADRGLSISLSEAELPGTAVDEDTQIDLLYSLYACPHGVIAWSPKIEGLVETSTSLASVKFKDNRILITTSQRSSSDSAKADVAAMVESVFRLANANVKRTGSYPGWNPNRDSKILNLTESAYKKLFGNEPVVRAIHAGLECGLFLEKYPGLDMISFGPTIKGAHSPDERLHIGSVTRFWDLLLEVLRTIP
ncbi:MAG: aminoacyl-histidine dipeptidase [Marinilabiliales bacterium]|nr:MAG: aminoacyl-histidine dipeptidase [Marinilabiliales bacterium]